MTKKIRLDRLGLAFSSAAALALTACGGGGGSSSDAAAPAPASSSTTNVTTSVIDGAIKNALVCLDKNGNGQCDSGEVQGRTDANGNVTLAVPNADVGKYAIVAMVGTDATDADTGAVPTAYTMSTPADKVAVVSPLTTLVHQAMASGAGDSTAAAKLVQGATGLSVSVFDDYTKVAAPSDGSLNAATLARMIVLATQQQQTAVAGGLGGTAIDGTTITQTALETAVQRKILELLPDVVAALNTPAVQAATTTAAKEAALRDAATALIGSSGLSASGLATAVGVINQTSAPATTAAPSAGYNLRALSYTDANNFTYRVFGASLVQATPDASNNTRYTERRVRGVAGTIAKWSAGTEPIRGADLHWNGSTWVNCPINFENTNSVRDAQGFNTYNYCDSLETGTSTRVSVDVSGKSLADVYTQMRSAGYTNLWIANPGVLGTATFPAGSSALYQSTASKTTAIGYYPGSSNIVTQYSSAVSSGGDATAQPSGSGCNSPEASASSTTKATTLEGLIAAMPGSPCSYAQGQFTYGGVTYKSDVPNEWWSNSTVHLGTIGSVLLNTGTAPGYYSGNTRLRAAFKGTGTNPVTYYACKERFTDGSSRNCTEIGTGSYTITTLGDARVLSFNNLPAQAGSLDYTRTLVERGGVVYFGYQSRIGVFNTARLNTTGANALLTTLGLPLEDPSVPLALTLASYQGVWDFRATTATSGGTTVYIGATGSIACQNRTTLAFVACTANVSDTATGAFSYDIGSGSSTGSGTLSFLTGIGSGTYHEPASTPTDGNWAAQRR
ncbi:MAG TPA: hypothetical protein VJO99_26095 [Burkholderiaceae bacterium]|nr:hypothetical protein [Burkholderiaceae bacterium]